jgi:hypothetical protein
MSFCMRKRKQLGFVSKLFLLLVRRARDAATKRAHSVPAQAIGRLTLGRVAEEKRFESRSDSSCGKQTSDRVWCGASKLAQGRSGKEKLFPCRFAFIDTRDAHARDAATKRAHSDRDKVTPRKNVQVFLFIPFFFFFFCSTDLQPLNP